MNSYKMLPYGFISPHFLLEFHTSFLEEVQIIDLSPSTSEVQDLFLTELMQTECSALWTLHRQIQTKKQTLHYKLFQNEVGWWISLDLFWKAKLYEIFLTAHVHFIIIAGFLDGLCHACIHSTSPGPRVPSTCVHVRVSLLNLRLKSRIYPKR